MDNPQGCLLSLIAIILIGVSILSFKSCSSEDNDSTPAAESTTEQVIADEPAVKPPVNIKLIDFNLLDAIKQIADTLGSSDRDGYGNGKWDGPDRVALMRVLELPEYTQLGDVRVGLIQEFYTHKLKQSLQE
jgi:hypothetical protein